MEALARPAVRRPVCQPARRFARSGFRRVADLFRGFLLAFRHWGGRPCRARRLARYRPQRHGKFADDECIGTGFMTSEPATGARSGPVRSHPAQAALSFGQLGWTIDRPGRTGYVSSAARALFSAPSGVPAGGQARPYPPNRSHFAARPNRRQVASPLAGLSSGCRSFFESCFSPRIQRPIAHMLTLMPCIPNKARFSTLGQALDPPASHPCARPVVSAGPPSRARSGSAPPFDALDSGWRCTTSSSCVSGPLLVWRSTANRGGFPAHAQISRHGSAARPHRDCGDSAC